jgi:hypothetical protein
MRNLQLATIAEFFAFICTVVSAGVLSVDKGQGCFEITASTYAINGTSEVYSIKCDEAYINTQYLQLYYVTSFAQCIQKCVSWDHAPSCEGVQYQYDTPGYDNGTVLCYLLWNLTNVAPTLNRNGVDLALALPLGPPVSPQLPHLTR